MNKWLKRIRGTLGVALTWAVGWGLVGALVGLLIGVLNTGGMPGTVFAGVVSTFMQAGLVAGGTFSIALGFAGRHRTFDEMSLPLFAVLGAVNAPLILGIEVALFGSWVISGPAVLVVTAVIASLGAASAAASLALARMADDRELLEAGEETADIGLTREERRELLGR